MTRKLKAEAEQYFTRAVKHHMDFHHATRSTTIEAEEATPKPRTTTNSSRHNVFYRQFRPMIFVLTAFGRAAIQKSTKGVYEWRWFSWLSLFCLLNYSAQTYLAVQICQQRFRKVFESTNYDEFIFAINIIAYVQIHFHVPISYWIQGRQYADYLNQWTGFEEEWYKVTGEKLELKHNRTSLLFVLIMLPALALLLVMEQYSTLHDPFELLLPYFFTIGSTACVLATWYITCLDIGAISRDLTHLLIQHLDTNPDPDFLRGWRNLWMDLGTLVTDLGSKHFAIMTSIFLTFSVTFLLCVYNALTQIIIGNFNLMTIGYLMASMLSISIIYIVCDSGHQAASGVKAYTSQCILKSRLSAPREEIKYEIDLILRVLESDCPEIQLCGFVVLNRPLFISFLASTMTYLIVILQFKG